MLDLSLDDKIFRVNPNYTLVAADRLPERFTFGSASAGHFGLFVPKRGADRWTQTVRASAEAALLYFSVRKPARLPFHLRSQLTVPMSDRVGNLLLAGILDVECNGEFVTGLRAIRLLEAGIQGKSRPESRTAAISDAALDYGYRFLQAASHAPSRAGLTRSVIQRLYQYNAVPPSRTSRALLSTEESVLSFLNIDKNEPVISSPSSRSWTFHPAERGGWWHHWQPGRTENARNAIDTLRDRTWEGDAKLYISPVVADLPRVLSASLPIVMGSDAVGMKIGASMPGLLRPDKMVVYFANAADLLDTAAVLAKGLGTAEAQGVPFTADLTGDGLLSWGSDTPADESAGRRTSSSWRVWVSEVLGNALVTASKRDLSLAEARDFAKAKAEFAGIDASLWRPKEHLLQTLS
ncbi:hypothetical protein [Fimbriimonas ginsengisoli]|uniref:Uncharacterized protein n=1 Tax=Fimbriimonas ginsengisoli Gsoil 348 TaxID=661478 RepID=A0A068NJC7_FIMGI|nr:hypothetical protein [Fimbriimonas ginsengisoli]AIE83718.1 hypothetical protein OP10G_0350 [Fimbriimonas ginsengisoli Gsoil 348]